MTDNIAVLLSHRDANLPSPPGIAVRIIEEIKREDCSLEGLSRIIETDPALVAKILRVANSSYYGVVTEVSSLARALAVLGLNAVKNVVLSFVLVENSRRGGNDAFNYEDFWRRSVTAAVSAELLSGLIRKPWSNSFITALLQDVGVVFMNICRQADYAKVLDEARLCQSNIADFERAVFGFDHQDVGAAVLKEWGLPDDIYTPIGCHHRPEKAPETWGFAAHILHMADNLALIYHGAHTAEAMDRIETILSRQYGVNKAQIDTLIDNIADKTVELLSFFDIPPGDMRPYSQILQDANAELGKLNLSYEKLLLQYKTAKESAENLALELKQANRKLRRLANTDGLTGLYNHRTFQELLSNRVSEANRHGRSLALILLDIDRFKDINDDYGHVVGDDLLKAVSNKMMALKRAEDILARYGGEEFALVLPETGVRGAVHLAERIREGIAEMVVTRNGVPLSVTASIGISANRPHQKDCKKYELITSADKALYMAKNAGRNSVRVSLLQSATAHAV